MREITLTKGYKALVDDEDFERVNAHEWCASEKRRADGTLWNVYAIRQVRVAGEKKPQLMHRFILGISNSKTQVDHAPDHNGLNNQKSNLRTTKDKNQRNAQLSRANTSGFKGVSWDKKKRKWVAQIRYIKNRFLGYFATAELAAKAYDAAALKYYGEFAYTNFAMGVL
jgi:hypothetical protein